MLSRTGHVDSVPALVAAIGDLHSMSTVGMCPLNGVPLDDGGRYEPSRGQEWLYREYLGIVALMRKLARGRIVYGVLNADLVDGLNHDTSQLVTRNLTTQREMAIEILQPFLEVCDRVYVTRGTPAHVGPASQEDCAIGKAIGAEPSPTGAGAWWMLPLMAGGVTMSFEHHATAGKLPWTRNSSAVRYAAAIVAGCPEGREPPRIVVRAHVHTYHDSHEAVPKCRFITSPCLCLTTEYGRRIPQPDPERIPDIGGVLIQARDGDVENIEVIHHAPEATPYWREKHRVVTGKHLHG